MTILNLSKKDKQLVGSLTLDGSKSISNRALIILALAGGKAEDLLTHLSTSKDTTTLKRLLESSSNIFDAGDAGTTFRFMTAFLSIQKGEQILTGSARMKERPIGGLVNALRTLGANIEYLENEGYPPLKISKSTDIGLKNNRIEIDGSTSSQFLSALLLIAPYLPKGLELVPVGNLVSRPYLMMTVKLMQYFGAEVTWQGDTIVVAPGQYVVKALQVEADWSAASYWYAMACFAEDLDLYLGGLFADSLQGDAVLSTMMTQLGIKSTFERNGVRLTKNNQPITPIFEKNFIECPDIAQTLAVVCAGMNVKGVFTGLETLAIKETDRISAIRTELKKVGSNFIKLPPHFSKKHPERTYFLIDAPATFEKTPRFATYKDHRMAMAFAPLAFFHAVEVENPDVVIKSYPKFWKDLVDLGFDGNTTEENL
jgi:3-phosphoshikimate 1-carboxyvinyltransferase